MIEYRIASREDIELLQSIRLEMLREVNGLPEDYAFSKELVQNSREYFLNGDQETVLALEGEKAVGCASISYITMMPTFSHPTGKCGHLMNVYTRELYRGQHIARTMVEMLIQEARKREVTEISLDATTAGRPLYETLGFQASEECMTLVL